MAEKNKKKGEKIKTLLSQKDRGGVAPQCPAPFRAPLTLRGDDFHFDLLGGVGGGVEGFVFLLGGGVVARKGRGAAG